MAKGMPSTSACGPASRRWRRGHGRRAAARRRAQHGAPEPVHLSSSLRISGIGVARGVLPRRRPDGRSRAAGAANRRRAGAARGGRTCAAWLSGRKHRLSSPASSAKRASVCGGRSANGAGSSGVVARPGPGAPARTLRAIWAKNVIGTSANSPRIQSCVASSMLLVRPQRRLAGAVGEADQPADRLSHSRWVAHDGAQQDPREEPRRTCRPTPGDSTGVSGFEISGDSAVDLQRRRTAGSPGAATPRWSPRCRPRAGGPATAAIVNEVEPWQWIDRLDGVAPVASSTCRTAAGWSYTAASSSVQAVGSRSIEARQLSIQTSQPSSSSASTSVRGIGGRKSSARTPAPWTSETGPRVGVGRPSYVHQGQRPAVEGAEREDLGAWSAREVRRRSWRRALGAESSGRRLGSRGCGAAPARGTSIGGPGAPCGPVGRTTCLPVPADLSTTSGKTSSVPSRRGGSAGIPWVPDRLAGHPPGQRGPVRRKQKGEIVRTSRRRVHRGSRRGCTRRRGPRPPRSRSATRTSRARQEPSEDTASSTTTWASTARIALGHGAGQAVGQQPGPRQQRAGAHRDAVSGTA